MARGWYLNSLKGWKKDFEREQRQGRNRLETLRGMKHPCATDMEQLLEIRDGWIKQIDAHIAAVTEWRARMNQIVRRVFGLTDQEIADLIRALKDAQNELCCGPGFPEANGFWERWERLIDRFENPGATAD